MASFRHDLDPTYKAYRPSIPEQRQRHSEQVWENSDPPATWLFPCLRHFRPIEKMRMLYPIWADPCRPPTAFQRQRWPYQGGL